MFYLTADNRCAPVAENADGGAIEHVVLTTTEKREWDYVVRTTTSVQIIRSALWDVRIGRFRTTLPADVWIVVGDRETADVDVVRVEDAVRRFDAVTINPFTSPFVTFAACAGTGQARHGVWGCPHMPSGSFLVYPLENGENPFCLLVAVDVPRQMPRLNVGDLL